MMSFNSAYASSVENSSHNNNNSIRQCRFVPKWCKVDDTLEGPTPRPRHGHRAVSIKELMLVFGGGNEGIVDELHLYDTNANQWYVPDLRGNKPRGYAAYGMVTNQSKVFIFGGMVEFGRYSNDLFELQIKRWEWRQLRVRPPMDGQPVPCPRLGHTFTIGLNNIAYVFGGLANDSDDPKFNVPKYLNDFYAIDLGGASNNLWWCCPKTNGQPPSPRESHTSVHFVTQTGNEQLIIYGGMNGTRLGDVWILDLISMNWSNPVPAGIEPSPRSLHTANLIGHRMFIFGGWVPTRPADKLENPDKEWKCTNTLAALNLNTLRWEPMFGPSSPSQMVLAKTSDVEGVAGAIWPCERAGHSAAVINKRIYIWSGRDGYKKMWNSQGVLYRFQDGLEWDGPHASPSLWPYLWFLIINSENRFFGIITFCCKDMFFLETEPPVAPHGIQLVKATVNSLEVSWTPSPTADRYILQIQKSEHQPDSEKTGRRPGVRLAQRYPFGSGSGGTTPPHRAVIAGNSASPAPVRAIRLSTAASANALRRYYHPQQMIHSSSASPVMMAETGLPLRIKPSVATSQRSTQHQLADYGIAITASSSSLPVSSHPPMATTTTFLQRPQYHSSSHQTSPRTIVVHKSPLVVPSDAEEMAANVNLTNSTSPSTTMALSASSVQQQQFGQKRIYVHTSDPFLAAGRMVKQYPNCPTRQRQTIATSNTFDILPPPAKMIKHMNFSSTVSAIVSPSEPLGSTTTKTTYAAPAAPAVIDQTMPHNILDEALNEAENYVDEQQQQQQLIQQQQNFTSETSGEQLVSVVSTCAQDDDGGVAPPVTETEQQGATDDVTEEAEQKGVSPSVIQTEQQGTTEDMKEETELKSEGVAQPVTETGQQATTEDVTEEAELKSEGVAPPVTGTEQQGTTEDVTEEAEQKGVLALETEQQGTTEDMKEETELKSEGVSQPVTETGQQATTEDVTEEVELKSEGVAPPPVTGTEQQGTAEDVTEEAELKSEGVAPPVTGTEQQGTTEDVTEEAVLKNQEVLARQQLLSTLSAEAIRTNNNSTGKNRNDAVEKDKDDKQANYDDDENGESGVEKGKEENTANVDEKFSMHGRRLAPSPSPADFIGHRSSIESGSKWYHIAELPSSTQRFSITQYSAAYDGTVSEGVPRTEMSAQLANYDEREGQQLQQSATANGRNMMIALEPGTLYKIRCRAVNSVGYSGWSQTASFKTCLPGFPGSPTSIKITKCPEGVYISWDPPLSSNGQIEEYSVYLSMRSSQQKQHMHIDTQAAPTSTFQRVYVGPEPNCVISHSVLSMAHIDMDNTPKPAIIFRISARNEKGYGSATQVRWLQESRAFPVAVMPPGALQPLPDTTMSSSSTRTTSLFLPQQHHSHIMAPSSPNIISSGGGRVTQKRAAVYHQQQQQYHQQTHMRASSGTHYGQATGRMSAIASGQPMSNSSTLTVSSSSAQPVAMVFPQQQQHQQQHDVNHIQRMSSSSYATAQQSLHYLAPVNPPHNRFRDGEQQQHSILNALPQRHKISSTNATNPNISVREFLSSTSTSKKGPNTGRLE